MTVGLGAVVACAPGIDTNDAGPGGCDSDLDCPDLEQCHPTLKQCEAPCTEDADCSEGRSLCNLKQDDDSYLLEVEGIRDLCICQDGDCGEGEECSAETGTCVPTDDQSCDASAEDPGCPDGEYCGSEGICVPECSDSDDCEVEGELCELTTKQCVAECSPIGADKPGDSDEVCGTSGLYEALCADDGCYPDGDLCSVDETDDAFNTCVAANDVTGTCADAAGHTAGDGPTIFWVEFKNIADANATNGECAFPQTYVADVYSDTAFNTSLYSQRLKLLGGSSSLTYSAGPSSGIHPEVEAVTGVDNEYKLTFYLCGTTSTPLDFAIALTDNNNAAGNAYCYSN